MAGVENNEVTFEDLFVYFIQEKYGPFFFIYICVYNFFLLLLFIIYPLLETYYKDMTREQEVVLFEKS